MMWYPIYGEQIKSISRRFNSCSILPMLLRFLAFLCVLGALISVSIAPKNDNEFNNQVDVKFVRIRAAAIALYSIAIAFLILQTLLDCITCHRDSKGPSIFASFIDVLMAYAVIGISIPLIVAELAIPPALVDTGAFLGAGVLGLIGAVFYVLHLFFSRFFQRFADQNRQGQQPILEQPIQPTYQIPVAYPIQM